MAKSVLNELDILDAFDFVFGHPVITHQVRGLYEVIKLY